MELKEALDYIFPVLGALALYILNDLKNNTSKASQSISELKDETAKLNVKMGIIIERTERHDKEIDDLKSAHQQTRERFHELGNHINRINGKIEKD